ncbi:MAG: M48 family metallopeptidase [Deltaproteobacteria bacterium]|nr:M48 family metallopeptidase [Deltaproteobacteria bacterium]
MSPKIPDAFKEHIDPETYRKGIKYQTERIHFGMFSTVFSSVIFLAFWFSGGFNFVDKTAISLSENYIFRGLLFFGILGVAQTVISIPVSAYSTFVIEKKYGFNKTTLDTWIRDRIKGTILSIVIGAPVLAFLIWFFTYLGNLAWIAAFAGISFLSILLQILAPILIMPLFNKFTPLEDGDLTEKIKELCIKAEFPYSGVYVVDGSKRSTKANAFFTGFGKTRRIALYDTLLETLTHDEIIGVLAHEIGHWQKKHLLRGIFSGLIQMAIMFYLMGIFLSKPGLFSAFRMENISVHAGMLLFTTLFTPLSTVSGILFNYFSRKHEYEADNAGKKLAGTGKHLAMGLIKLSVNNLSNLKPHPLNVFLHYSHPPVLERINNLIKDE